MNETYTPIPNSENIYANNASFWPRVWAVIIDGFVVGVPYLIVYLTLRYGFGIIVNENYYSIILLIYNVLFHWKKGATIGKSSLDLAVETRDGNRISLEQAIKREVFVIVPFIIELLFYILNPDAYVGSTLSYTIITLIGIGSLIDIFWVLGSKRMTLHDFFADTYCRNV